MSLDSSIQKQIESRLYTSVRNLTILLNILKFALKTITPSQIYIFRTMTKGDNLILKYSRTSLCKVNSQTISYFTAPHSGPRICITTHRPRSIQYTNCITFTLNSIRKILPHSFHEGKGIFIFAIPRDTLIELMDNLTRIQYRSIDFCLSSLKTFKVSCITVFVMLHESFGVKFRSFTRNLFVVNGLPVIATHKPFTNINMLTKNSHTMSILRPIPLKILSNNSSPLHGNLRTSSP